MPEQESATRVNSRWGTSLISDRFPLEFCRVEMLSSECVWRERGRAVNTLDTLGIDGYGFKFELGFE